MTGVGLAFSGTPAPTVASRNRKFDEANNTCLVHDLPGANTLEDARQQGSQVLNESRRSLLNHDEPAIKKLLLSRLERVRRTGYPKLISSKFLPGATAQELRRLNIQPGKYVGPRHKSNRPPDGFVTTYPTVPRSYKPSPAEVKFALTYIACGHTLGFSKKT
jgi:hypothetical protein